KSEDGGVGGIDFAVDGGIRKTLGEKIGSAVDGGLHFLLGNINVEIEIELKGDYGTAEGARRGHLVQAGNLAELALERGGDRRSHDVRAGARIKGLDLNRRIVDLGKRGNRKLAVG